MPECDLCGNTEFVSVWRSQQKHRPIGKLTNFARCRRCNRERKQKYRANEENRKRLTATNLAYQRRNRDKVSAWNALNRAVKRGVIIRPDSCQKCSLKTKPQAHHKDYTKKLDVEWLCTGCHSEADKLRRSMIKS